MPQPGYGPASVKKSNGIVRFSGSSTCWYGESTLKTLLVFADALSEKFLLKGWISSIVQLSSIHLQRIAI